MKKKLLSIVGFGIISALALTLAADSEAGIFDRLRKDKRAKHQERGPQMTAAIYSGPLRGEIKLQNRKVLITADTMVYVIGEGVKDRRSMVISQRPMAVTGTLVGDVLVAEMVIIRPKASSSHTLSESSNHRTTRGANPNVGIVDKGDFE